MNKEEIHAKLLDLGRQFYDICGGESEEEDGTRVILEAVPLIEEAISIGYTFDQYVEKLKEESKEKNFVWNFQEDLFAQQIIPIWRGWNLFIPEVMEKFMQMGPLEQDKALGLDKPIQEAL